MDPSAVLITFPVKWDDVPFEKVVKGDQVMEVNTETAIEQLERYKLLQNAWCQQNVSSTISYSPEEVPAIIDWLLDNWDSYVGVSFLFRMDPTMTAKDAGYLYMPQEVVTQDVYEAYASTLQPISLEQKANSFEDFQDDPCATGACPIR